MSSDGTVEIGFRLIYLFRGKKRKEKLILTHYVILFVISPLNWMKVQAQRFDLK